MTALTRADVEIIDRHVYPYTYESKDWMIRVRGPHYRICSVADHLGGGPATFAIPWRQPGDDMPPVEEEPRGILAESIVRGRDHWACIDRLLAWLSLDVEDGWSRPTLHVSHRIDLEPVDLVAVFAVAGEHTIKVWTVRDLAAHFDAWRGDDTGDGPDEFHREHPATIYVRQGAHLTPAIYERVRHGDGDEVRVIVGLGRQVVAAARY